MIRSRVLVAGLLTALLAAGHAMAEPAAIRALVADAVRAMAAQQDRHLAELRSMAELPEVRAYFLAPADERDGRLAKVHAVLGGRKMGSELCLIDELGSEHLRAVQGRLAPSSELAHNEVSAPFFAPSIVMAAGEHHISAPYLSPDVEQWVVGYVVPVIPGKAILHFEHPVTELQKTLPAGPGRSGRILMLVDDKGFILADTTRAVGLGMRSDKTEPASYFANLRAGGSAIPAEVAATILAAESGARTADWGGRTWEVAWGRVGSLTVVGAEPAP